MASPQKGSPTRGSFELMSSDHSKRGRSNTYVKSNFASPSRNFGLSTPVKSINLSPRKISPLKADGKLRDEHTLFKPVSVKSEIAIQTENDQAPPASKKGIRFQDQEESEEEKDETDLAATMDYQNKEVDNYKEDWADSIVYKKAMKAEAIKRGLPYQEYEVVDDEEAYDLQTVFDRDDDENLQDAQDASHRHQIGFMKKFNEKGNIQMLKESEVTYLKTLLKKE